MLKNTVSPRLITAISALLFSINVSAVTSNEVTQIKVLPKKALPIKELSTKDSAFKVLTKSSVATTSNCITDSVITATELSDTRDNGPFSVARKHVPRQLANGFGGGTIHYPTNAGGCGLLGGIAVIPGYVSYEASIKWWGPRLASWGFVVITINTNSIYDDPDNRATQL
ncbi:MAG: hypothetical protein L0H51_08415, partial [Psychrobacter sp.]|nr:hypothetical protein [Psychrobacter sp.]